MIRGYYTYVNKNRYAGKIITKKTQKDQFQQILFGKDKAIKKEIRYIPLKFSYYGTISNNQAIVKLLTGNFHPYFLNILNLTRMIDDAYEMYEKLKEKHPNINEKTTQLYTRKYIPKRKPYYKEDGTKYYKKRKLDVPIDELKELQELLKDILKISGIKEHDAAHAYVEKRSNVTNAKIHKYSKHILNIDLKDFFPSISSSMIKKELSRLIHFDFRNIDLHNGETRQLNENQIIELLQVKENIHRIYEMITDVACYRNTGLGVDYLPQGSPLSPILTNLVMMRFDYILDNKVKTKTVNHPNGLLYTRYCDDLTFSSFKAINKYEVLQTVNSVLNTVSPSMKINMEKIKYLTSSGKCYVTGVKINKDQNATYGHEKKAILKREIFQLFMARKNGEDVSNYREILGKFAYAKSIEPQSVKNIINKYCEKFNIRPSLMYKWLEGTVETPLRKPYPFPEQ